MWRRDKRERVQSMAGEGKRKPCGVMRWSPPLSSLSGMVGLNEDPRNVKFLEQCIHHGKPMHVGSDE